MNDAPVSILITGIGAPLGQSIARAAMCSKRKYRLVVTALDEEEKAIFPGAEFYRMCHVSSAEYCRKLTELIETRNVNLIYFGSEKEMIGSLPFYRQIETETGVTFALSPETVLNTGMDKLGTVELLRKTGLAFPKTRLIAEDPAENQTFVRSIGYPCIIKGRRAGIPVIVKNNEELSFYTRNYHDGVIQEYLGGENTPEFTVGVFYTPEHGVIDIYCMERQLKYGLTWRGKYVKNPVIENICRRAVKALNPKGSVNVQLRTHKGQPVIHEFNVRCSTTTVFRAMSGWNEIDMAVDYFVYGKKPKKTGPVRPGTAVRFFYEVWLPEEKG